MCWLDSKNGLPLGLHCDAVDDRRECLYEVIESFSFKNISENSIPAIQSLAASLEETDNPVLIRYHLKKWTDQPFRPTFVIHDPGDR